MLGLDAADRWLLDLQAYRKVALDTNVVIYLLEGVQPYKGLAQHLFRMMDRGFMMATVSTVVEAETLVGPLRARDRPAIENIELFFRNAPNLRFRSLDRTIARRAAEVRATTRLRLPDAVVVATALEERCDALVGNDAAMAGRTFGLPYVYMGDYVS
jgi:predicted nucleic acid-binding protein